MRQTARVTPVARPGRLGRDDGTQPARRGVGTLPGPAAPPRAPGESRPPQLVLPVRMQSARRFAARSSDSVRSGVSTQGADLHFALAVSEAFSNAVRHGTSRPGDSVEAWIRITPETAHVTLRYPGQPFAITPPTLLEAHSTNGRGRYLMSVLADCVDDRFAEGSTQIELEKVVAFGENVVQVACCAGPWTTARRLLPV